MLSLSDDEAMRLIYGEDAPQTEEDENDDGNYVPEWDSDDEEDDVEEEERYDEEESDEEY